MSTFTRLVLVLAVLTTAVACDPDSLVAGGGIGGSGISRGPITGFGSVFVNGIEWDTSETEIEFEGLTGIEDDLEIGMIVVIEGDFSRDGTRGVARSLRYDDELEGPITGITPMGGDGLVKQLRILGKNVVVERGVTRFDDDDSSFTFDSIDLGDVVEVSGYVEESGTIVATFIERKGDVNPGSTEVELKGVIQGFADGTTFQLGAITVSFDPTGAATDLSELPGGVANDRIVEVKGVFINGEEIDARKIELEDDLGSGDDDLEKLNLEGIVSDFISDSNFRVSGQAVDATNAQFEGGTSGQLADGVRIRVEGARVNGVLRAEKVKIRADELRVQAAVANDADVDPEAGTLRLLGIAITVNSGTRIVDDRDGVDRFSLADLEAGDFLEVRGLSDGAGGIIATLVERKGEEKVSLRGIVEVKDEGAGTVTILGVTVATHRTNTKFEGENDASLEAAQFFAQLGIGDLVSVKDEVDADPTAIDFADEMEIERVAPRVSAGLAWLPTELPEAVASPDGESPMADAEEDEGAAESRRSGSQMVRTVRLYFAVAEARAREARERNAIEESRGSPTP